MLDAQPTPHIGQWLSSLPLHEVAFVFLLLSAREKYMLTECTLSTYNFISKLLRNCVKRKKNNHRYLRPAAPEGRL